VLMRASSGAILDSTENIEELFSSIRVAAMNADHAVGTSPR